MKGPLLQGLLAFPMLAVVFIMVLGDNPMVGNAAGHATTATEQRERIGKEQETPGSLDELKEKSRRSPDHLMSDARSASNSNYDCVTQKSMLKPYPNEIRIGIAGKIPRWKPGSIIRYTVRTWSFLLPDDADCASRSLDKAAEEWNKKHIGVQFKRAT